MAPVHKPISLGHAKLIDLAPLPRVPTQTHTQTETVSTDRHEWNAHNMTTMSDLRDAICRSNLKVIEWFQLEAEVDIISV